MDKELALPEGWTGWVQNPEMTSPMGGKIRPFCRGRCREGHGPWFPRTTKEPWPDERGWAVFSPADHLPGLHRKGWFLAHMFLYRVDCYRPTGEACGIVEASYLDALHTTLEGFFWSQGRFGRR